MNTLSHQPPQAARRQNRVTKMTVRGKVEVGGKEDQEISAHCASFTGGEGVGVGVGGGVGRDVSRL